MGVVAVGSVRSCGVTTLVSVLAHVWAGERRLLVVEADPAGGSLAAGVGWAPEPSSVTLAAAARRGVDAAMMWAHCQHTAAGTAVLAGPASAEQATSALAVLVQAGFAGRLAELDGDAIVDCGRLGPASPALGLWDGADVALLVLRPTVADLHAVAAWIEGHRPRAERLGLVVAGPGDFPDGEIAAALGVEVWARLPWDPRTAAALAGGEVSARALRVAPLARAGRSLADGITEYLPPPAGQESGSGPERPSVGMEPLGPWVVLPAGTPHGDHRRRARR